MTTSQLHAPLSPRAGEWLAWLADPAPTAKPPRAPINDDDLSRLLVAAEFHGVLMTCLSSLKRPEAGKCGTLGGEGRRQEILDAGSRRSIERLSVQMLLAHHGRAVQKALEARELPFMVVKGQSFADRLYPRPTFRTYTDVDLLIPKYARSAVGDVLKEHGFELEVIDYRKNADYFEDKWILHADQNVLVEVHCDLVHNPKLRRSFHLGFDDVMEAGRGDRFDATALLLVASAHGAVGHQFDRLQHLIDVLQCARGVAGPIDVNRLRDVAKRCGLTFAIVAALDLAGRTFDDPSCRSLLAELAPRSFARVASRLLSPALVLDAQSERRPIASWRRKIFRQALRSSARRSASHPAYS